MNNAISEKREYRRAPVDIFVHEKSETDYYIHPAVNISPDGMHLVVDGLLEQDRLERVEFTLPNSSRTIKADTRVAWYAPHTETVFRVGLQFVGMGDDDRLVIESYCNTTMSGGRALTVAV